MKCCEILKYAKKIKMTNNTSLEIYNQPDLWIKTYDQLQNHQGELSRFLEMVYGFDDLNIILTGAGTSAFIGKVLQGPFQKHTNIPTRAIATTDLVSHPSMFFQSNRTTLLVSFARSGDSPESLAAVELADEVCDNVYHLIISCNQNGKLAHSKNPSNKYIFILPEGANDKGLAMTGSFTSMLLVGLLIARIKDLTSLKSQVLQLSSYANEVLHNYTEKIKQVAALDFKRAVFLGSGPQLGVAEESHLKLQELTDGIVICKHDSFLGFRHGPKAIIDDSTLIVYLFSNNAFVQQYEEDLVQQITKGGKGIYSIAIMESDSDEVVVDLKIITGNAHVNLEEEFLAVCNILPAQLLGYFKSLQLGINPDNPSTSGAISRVVKGVEIYPYQEVLKNV